MKFPRLGLASVIALGLAGCSGSGEAAPPARAEVADRFGYDEGSATLTPVYALVPEFGDPRDGYARDLLARDCLAGIVAYRPVQLDASSPYFDERTGQRLFTEAIAAQWGYSADRLNPPAPSAIPDGVTITDEMMESMQACGARADERLGRPPEILLNDILAAGWMAATPETSSEVEQAEQAWRVCMEPAGVVDLGSPTEMPTRSVETPGTVNRQGEPAGDPLAPPSSREVEVAVLDAQCRESTGYTDAVFEARVEAELDQIGRNLEQFEAVRDEYRAYQEGVDAVVAELG